jgi:hypothetical protein
MPVTPSQLQTILAAMIPARLPLLSTGSPGIGKSDIIAQAAQQAGADLIISHPAVSDPTDFKGLPWPNADGNSANFIPFGEFNRALTANKLTVWFFDDLGQAPPSVQAACMQLFLARRVNGHVLPDCVTFLAATNRRIDRAGVSGILEPVKSRFVSIVELEPDIDSWSQWAFSHGIPATLIAFLRFRPELLCKFEATADLTNSPVPRTWAHLAKVEALNLPAAIESAVMAGSVGEGASLEYLAFRSMYKSMVNLDSILLDPAHVTIPSKPSELYATVIGLAHRANSQNFARIATYATRLATEPNAQGNTRGEFSVLLVKSAEQIDPTIAYTDARIRLSCGPVGKLYSGQA